METAYELQCQVPTIEPQGEGVFRLVQSGLETVQGWINAGFKLIDAIFDIDSVLEKINEAFNKMKEVMEILRKVAEKVLEAIKGVFMPWIMPDYADKWLQISNDLANVAEVAGPEGLRAPGSLQWTGQAADEYRKRAAESCEAAEFASTTASEYSAALADAAHRGQQLYLELLLLVVAIIAEILLAAVEAGTIVGIPAAIITLLAGVVPLEVAIVATITALFEFVKNQVTTFNLLKDSIKSAENVFPGQAWPKIND